MPGFSTEQEMMTNPDERYDHRLAERLGMTVAQIRDMPMSEWMSWSAYDQAMEALRVAGHAVLE